MDDIINLFYDNKLYVDVINEIRLFSGISYIKFYSCIICKKYNCHLYYTKKCCLCEMDINNNNMYQYKIKNKIKRCVNKTMHYCPSCKNNIYFYKI